jgi:hypothetical protein
MFEARHYALPKQLRRTIVSLSARFDKSASLSVIALDPSC